MERRPGQSFAEVIAEPAAELDRDREVLLVWSEEDPDNQYGTVKLVESE